MATTTKQYYLSGKTKWFRHTAPDEWGKWQHVLYPNPASLEIIRELQAGSENVQGIKNQLKKDDDGYFLRIGRKTEEKFKGQLVGLAPPIVVDGSKPLPDGGGYAPITGPIGNGSDVTTKVEVYKHKIPGSQGKYGTAMRWVSSRIDNLVPYEGKGDFTPSEQEAVGGLEKQPQPNYGF